MPLVSLSSAEPCLVGSADQQDSIGPCSPARNPTCSSGWAGHYQTCLRCSLVRGFVVREPQHPNVAIHTSQRCPFLLNTQCPSTRVSDATEATLCNFPTRVHQCCLPFRSCSPASPDCYPCDWNSPTCSVGQERPHCRRAFDR